MPTLAPHVRLILASASPRRKFLLEQAGLRFEVRDSRFDEDSIVSVCPLDAVCRLAEAKAETSARTHPDAWVIGADTAVVIDGRTLGKPADHGQARAMLERLGGRSHQVHTGYAILCRSQGLCKTAVVTTEVTFKTLSAGEIQWYLETGEPFDKAGAYAIQGQGAFLVRRISGSYTNVVGLPVCEVIEDLAQSGALEP